MTGRYVVLKRKAGGLSWFKHDSRDEPKEACSLAEQLATRGKSGEAFRVIDSHCGGGLVFEVENP